MNRQIRLRQTDDRKVYWVSDTHLNHDPKWPVPIWEMRGYNSSNHHTDSIIDGINERVRPNDILIHVGDVCLNTEESGLNELLARIQCQNIYLVWGNHNNPLWKVYQREVKEAIKLFDAGIPDEWNDVEIYPFRWKNIVFLGNYVEITVDGHLFAVCHYPMYVWNHLSNGAKMICGHSHCALPFSNQTNLDAKILDVGWDDYKKPLSNGEVLAIMNKKAVFKPGDHHQKKEYFVDANY